ncbi:MAG: RIP metalloprotease RseP [Rhodobacterales bacterium]|nr:MAG: RIP metalloprotease RseP [Rhodobacterales bacterium]
MDFLGLLPSFGNFSLTAVAFVVTLLIIVAVHEYGHYIIGRLCGIHADVFSLGFGPVIWSRYDKRGTKWQIAALPFGGFVKFYGDSDAASGKDADAVGQLSEQELRRTMHGAPLWARFLTVLAGPVFNFILSIALLTGLAMFSGVPSYPPVIDEIHALPDGVNELQPGDELLAINGVKFPARDDFQGFVDKLPVARQLDYTVKRDGQEITVMGPPLSPTRVDAVTPGWSAEQAGIRVDDVILSINGQNVFQFSQMIPLVSASKGEPAVIKLWRDGKIIEVTLKATMRDLPTSDTTFETRYLMGISGGYFFTTGTRSIGFGEALVLGSDRTLGIVTQSLWGLYHMVAGKISSCNISGPIGIAKVSGQMASRGGWDFIYFIALLSTAIGLMNLFPVPVLDGGHLAFFTFEAITGKPPSDRILRVLMAVGLALLLTLMVFAVTNDLFCP